VWRQIAGLHRDQERSRPLTRASDGSGAGQRQSKVRGMRRLIYQLHVGTKGGNRPLRQDARELDFATTLE